MLELLFGLGQLYELAIDYQKYTPLEIHDALGVYDVQALLRTVSFDPKLRTNISRYLNYLVTKVYIYKSIYWYLHIYLNVSKTPIPI